MDEFGEARVEEREEWGTQLELQLEPARLAPVALEPVEATLVGLVLAACELSEDETEVMDLVAGAIDTGRVQLLPESPEVAIEVPIAVAL